MAGEPTHGREPHTVAAAERVEVRVRVLVQLLAVASAGVHTAAAVTSERRDIAASTAAVQLVQSAPTTDQIVSASGRWAAAASEQLAVAASGRQAAVASEQLAAAVASEPQAGLSSERMAKRWDAGEHRWPAAAAASAAVAVAAAAAAVAASGERSESERSEPEGQEEEEEELPPVLAALVKLLASPQLRTPASCSLPPAFPHRGQVLGRWTVRGWERKLQRLRRRRRGQRLQWSPRLEENSLPARWLIFQLAWRRN